MTFSRFDVVVVPFPFTDRSTTVRRPALILSDPETFGIATGQSLMAMITRAAGMRWPHDHAVGDRASAGLPEACFVRMKLFTLDHRLMLRKLCALGKSDAIAVRATLDALLGHMETS